ncbi:hypothetical protein AAG906_004837 [Vitis piasezkii]
MLGTQLKMSFAYHPQTDGKSKVVNRCVEQYLRYFIYQQPCQWSTFLPWAELSYNTAYHSSTDDGTLVIEPKAILDTHWVKHGAKFSQVAYASCGGCYDPEDKHPLGGE